MGNAASMSARMVMTENTFGKVLFMIVSSNDELYDGGNRRLTSIENRYVIIRV
jgi:hypothetical protein